MRGIFAAAILAATGAAVNMSAQAQDYPTRTITMVVPFTAGGPTDTVARLIAEAMQRDLGQQIIVENVQGAGGTLGAGRVAKAEPDGYTLLLHHIGMATSATLYRSLPYDPRQDFAPIGLVTAVPMTIVARADFPPKDAAELLSYLKENGDKVNYANAGIGAASHLCGMLIMRDIGAKLTTVPYKGTGPAMTDLIGGQVDLMCDQTTNTTNQIKGGKIKAYAVTTPERLQVLPDLPTTQEAGLPGVQVTIWHGLYAPKGTPDAVVQRLTASLQKALQDQNVVQRFAELGTAPSSAADATPEALGKMVSAEIDRWAPVIKDAGEFAD
jgi:tripartite-type tricarboxylate transporter receptor subunit TctC